MKRLNQKGFSMIELLAVIVILGILSTVAIVSISAVLNRAEKNHYATQEKNIILAAESYAQDNKSVLPKEIGGTKTITLQELQSRKYIGDVVDRSKTECTTGEVTIFKYSKDGYSYKAYLKCPKYETKKDQYDEDGPTIDLKLNNNYTDPYFTYAITTTGENKIISYSYQIYKSGVLVKNSGSVPVSKAGKISLKEESLKEYVPGKIEVVFKATNIYGYSSTKKVSGNIVPGNAPECIITDATTNYTEADWRRHNGPVEVTIGCKDKNGNGCAKEIFSQLFYDDTKTGNIEIVDNDGVKNSCTVGVYIDNTPPTKPVIKNDYENIWINKSYTIEVTSKDETAGIKSFQYRYPNSNVEGEQIWHDYPDSSSEPGEEKTFVTPAFSKEGIEYVEIRACDYVGNCSEVASSVIKIDFTKPFLIGYSLSGFTSTAKCDDALSGITTAKLSKKLSSSSLTHNVVCTDVAGNQAQFSKTYKYDSCLRRESTCQYGCSTCPTYVCDSYYAHNPSSVGCGNITGCASCHKEYPKCNCSSCYTGSPDACVGGIYE